MDELIKKFGRKTKKSGIKLESWAEGWIFYILEIITSEVINPRQVGQKICCRKWGGSRGIRRDLGKDCRLEG